MYFRDAEEELKRIEEELKKLQQTVESSASSKISLLRMFRKANKWAKELDVLLRRMNTLYGRVMGLSLTKRFARRMSGAGPGPPDEGF